MGLARLPWPVQRRLGAIVGWLALRLSRSRREAARTNLALCLPELDAAQRERLLRDNFRDVGIGLFEFARAWWGDAEPMRGTATIENLDVLQRLQTEGRGVLLVSGHFMTLEMCGRLLCDHVPLAGMYRRHRSPVMEWAVLRGRLRYASAMFGNGDTRAAIRHLKRGGLLWYAPDQDMRGKDTVFAPFFGIPAATITATHQFARMTGCAVVSMTASSVGKGASGLPMRSATHCCARTSAMSASACSNSPAPGGAMPNRCAAPRPSKASTSCSACKPKAAACCWSPATS